MLVTAVGRLFIHVAVAAAAVCVYPIRHNEYVKPFYCGVTYLFVVCYRIAGTIIK